MRKLLKKYEIQIWGMFALLQLVPLLTTFDVPPVPVLTPGALYLGALLCAAFVGAFMMSALASDHDGQARFFLLAMAVALAFAYVLGNAAFGVYFDYVTSIVMWLNAFFWLMHLVGLSSRRKATESKEVLGNS